MSSRGRETRTRGWVLWLDGNGVSSRSSARIPDSLCRHAPEKGLGAHRMGGQRFQQMEKSVSRWFFCSLYLILFAPAGLAQQGAEAPDALAIEEDAAPTESEAPIKAVGGNDAPVADHDPAGSSPPPATLQPPLV